MKKTKQEILNDPQYSAFQRARIFEQMDAAGNSETAVLPPITPAIAAELRLLAADIMVAVKAVQNFDAQDSDHRRLLEGARQELNVLEVTNAMPDDSQIHSLVFARVRVELMEKFLIGSPGKRTALMPIVRTGIRQLARRLGEVTDRTMARDFENPNLRIVIAAEQALGEVERVISGKPDAFEMIDQTRRDFILS